MNARSPYSSALRGTAAMLLMLLANFAFAQFQVSSTTFANDTTMPLSTINNILYMGFNVCTVDGSIGGDESPELSWTNAPKSTQTFAVIAYDSTAAVVHWGMYNIPSTTTGLPENAGVTGSSYGEQVVNIFGISSGNNGANTNYGGPCPPPDYPPDVHHYVFTVYALDTDLTLPGSPDFPPNAFTLFRELVRAREHILATASLTGLYSNTP